MTVKQGLRACEKERRQCLVDIHGNLLTVPHAVTEFTSDTTEKQLTKEAAEAILLLANDGYTNAQATAGGAALSEFDAGTFMSKKVNGLFAIGEVLDVDGDCGGYNLTWAFSAGLAAAKGCHRFLTSNIRKISL